jgi:hypothetical protein
MDDFLSFYQVLYAINDVDTALTFHHLAGAHMEPDTLRHVARTVAGVNLSEHVLSVVFVLFDENGDGKLSNKVKVGRSLTFCVKSSSIRFRSLCL